MSRKHGLLALTAALLASASTAAFALDVTTDDEIIVFGRAASDTLFTIPQSIDVLDSALIEATASETVGDALRFIPGASRDGSTLDAFGDTYLIRGFEPIRQSMASTLTRCVRRAIALASSVSKCSRARPPYFMVSFSQERW